MSFNTLGLRAELVKATESLGFQTPTPIQEKAIPVLGSGERDFVGLAQTGTGKTGAFGLPLLQHIDSTLPQAQGIVICPTRELCLQITEDLKKFAAYMKDIRIVAIYGGASISIQIGQLRKGPQIIVATPGRMIDMINRKAVSLSHISYTVLDEADEMLNMGFQEDIDSILEKIKKDRRIWLFSATMPKGVAAIARNYLVNPVEVTVGEKNRSPENISHICYAVHEKNRYEALKRLIASSPDMFALVFCRTRKDTQSIAESLIQDGYQAESLHGDLSQSQRDSVMRKFRQGTVRVLVATDVAARGLDVDDISHVIHYNLPDESESYTHRSGRTARAGKSGISVALINTKEMHRIRALEKKLNIRFVFSEIPDGRALCRSQLFRLVEKIVSMEADQAEINDYLPAVCEALERFDKTELIRRFISAEFSRFLEHYHHADDINVKTGLKSAALSKTVSKPAKRKERNDVKLPKLKQINPLCKQKSDTLNKKSADDIAARGAAEDPSVSKPAKRKERSKTEHSPLNKTKTQRFFINVGRLDKINEGAIIRLICDKSGIRSGMIGEVSLNREFSFFEVEKSAAARVRDCLNNATLDGRPVQVQKVEKKKKNR